MSNFALIIFIKNPIIGKVKTRLAKEIGNEKALEIYHLLLDNTRKITENMDVDKFLYYSIKIDRSDSWNSNSYFKRVQRGSNLGEKMHNAIKETLKEYKGVVLIGSDNFELTSEIIEESFKMLEIYDVIIGPAKDGGYYLIGMKNPYRELFYGKKWSTSTVFRDTMRNITDLGLKATILPTLSDIDDIDDLNNSGLKNMID